MYWDLFINSWGCSILAPIANGFWIIVTPAGTFSDGKLTTRIKDIRCRKVLDELVNFGSPEEILYSHKPHVGTDIYLLILEDALF